MMNEELKSAIERLSNESADKQEQVARLIEDFLDGRSALRTRMAPGEAEYVRQRVENPLGGEQAAAMHLYRSQHAKSG